MKKYQEIYNDLKEKIRTNVYPAETSLPTEQQLQEMYQVSRDTVRKALAILTERGMIQKVQGRGSLVLKQELLNFPISGLTSYQELTDALQLQSDTAVVDLELITVNNNLSQLTGFEPFSKVWKIVRIRSIDGKVSVVDTDYLSSDIVPKMDKEIAKGSIYQYLEKELKLDISYAQKEITVDGEPVKLTPIEYNILLLLVKNQGKVFSIDQIYESIWNEDAIGVDNTVAVHIRHIREKIEINPKEPRYLKVVWGVGYKIEKL